MIRIITEYWAQLAVILGAIGYVSQSIIAIFVKKNEIKFGSLHANRIIQVEKFFGAYYDLELQLKYFHQRIEFGGLDSEDQNFIARQFNTNWKTFFIVSKLTRLFVSEEQLNILIKVEDQLKDIHKSLNDVLKQSMDTDIPTNFYQEEMASIELKMDNELSKTLRELEVSLRKIYK